VNRNTAFGISERSHGDIWKLAENDEDLPLYTVFAEELGPVTSEHCKMAMEGLQKCP